MPIVVLKYVEFISLAQRSAIDEPYSKTFVLTVSFRLDVSCCVVLSLEFSQFGLSRDLQIFLSYCYDKKQLYSDSQTNTK